MGFLGFLALLHLSLDASLTSGSAQTAALHTDIDTLLLLDWLLETSRLPKCSFTHIHIHAGSF